jgi:Ca-activated chloride channel family protein
MGRIAAVLMAVALLAGQEDPSDVIRVESKLVRLLATVKTESGQRVGDLAAADFEIADEGVKQTISVFERQTEQPLSIAVLVDTSLSTKNEVRAELDAVRRFFQAFFRSGNPEDRVSLYAFHDEVRQLAGFTRNLSLLERRLAAMDSAAGTSLYDALYFAAADLEEREGRHAIVVVTDGGDTTSGKTFAQARRAVQQADTSLYGILITPIKGNAGQNLGGENALQLLSESTGGVLFRAGELADLDRGFRAILEDLRTQYLLAYAPTGVVKPRDGYHRVKVTVKRPGLAVVSRTGYFDK